MKVIPHSVACRQSGVAVVEFAFLLTLLLVVAAGIFEFGRAFWYYDALAKATRDGARFLSTADRATFTSFRSPARTLVANSANSANLNGLSGPVTDTDGGNVDITCLDASFNTIACADGANAPANIRVSITGFAIDIGGIFPFIFRADTSTKFTAVPLGPHTTMRYMN